MSEQQPEDWPVWATEEVEVKPADPQWIVRGQEEAARLRELLAPYGVEEIEHMGSTSIPGLPAKPILDLMGRIANYDELPALTARLAEEDWHYVPPELDGIPSRRFFVKVKEDRRQCHLHLMQDREERWDLQLRFRDILRLQPELADEYAQLKLRLAERYKDDREAYTRSKSDFVKKVLSL